MKIRTSYAYERLPGGRAGRELAFPRTERSRGAGGFLGAGFPGSSWGSGAVTKESQEVLVPFSGGEQMPVCGRAVWGWYAWETAVRLRTGGSGWATLMAATGVEGTNA